MKNRPAILALAACALSIPLLYAQNPPASGTSVPAGTPSAASPAGAPATGAAVREGSASVPADGSQSPAPLSGTYRSVSLGMNVDEVKKALLADPIFGYRGDRDVSLLPTMNRTLIETSGYSFIKRAWFQFRDDALYVMTLSLDPSMVDYYSIYKGLVAKYGEPSALDPAKATWGDGIVTLTLERPLTVKYVDAVAFASLLESSGTEKAASDLVREEFVNGF